MGRGGDGSEHRAMSGRRPAGWEERPKVPDVVERFKAYHLMHGHGAWGSLHVVLDDGNLADHNVEGCIDWARLQGDEEGELLGRILLRMSKTQRGRIAQLA